MKTMESIFQETDRNDTAILSEKWIVCSKMFEMLRYARYATLPVNINRMIREESAARSARPQGSMLCTYSHASPKRTRRTATG